ncbi:hypothetical protein M569_01608, partial [Genlisea aurea]
RKRRRFVRQTSVVVSSPPLKRWSQRLLFFCVASLIFVFILSFTTAELGGSSVFRPVLMVQKLALLSESVSPHRDSPSTLKIESRVSFPDHVLLLVSGDGGGDLECVYYCRDDGGCDFYTKEIIGFDEYDGLGWAAVRCPVPSSNYLNVVGLKRKNGVAMKENLTGVVVHSWSRLVYAAVIDGDDVVLFVKGLNLKPGRVSDPTPLTCHFLRSGEKNSTATTTRASLAAQEIVRCPLPTNTFHQSTAVTVGFRPYRSHRGGGPVLIPSVARISGTRPPAAKKKHELCVCSMVWNQASAIKEWILYHSWLGVERWFIYDNNSDDGIDEILQQLNLNISRHFWPWIKAQEAGFSHCALRARDECAWVSFMDVDEYFHLPFSSSHSLLSLVANFTTASSRVGEIRTSCYSFGPSGLISHPERGVTTGYTCRLQSPERHKSMVRLDALDPSLLNVVHHFRLKEGFRYLNLPRTTAVINHYKYQVWDVFRAKYYMRAATYVADWHENKNEGSRDRAPGLGTEAVEPADWPRRYCQVWDSGLRKFVLANLVDSSTGLLPWEISSAL